MEAASKVSAGCLKLMGMVNSTGRHAFITASWHESSVIDTTPV